MAARLGDYWGLYYGHESWVKDMHPATEHVVFQLNREGTVELQPALIPEALERPQGDMLARMPQKVTQRQAWEEGRIAEVRRQLKRAIRIPNET